jgi:hypothetical protein
MAIRACRSLVPSLVACLALALPPAAQSADYIDDQPSPEGMLVDGLIVRPLGLAATVAGTAIWIVTLPFSLLGGNAGEAADTLVVDPAKFTFTRPLGDL